MASRSTWTPTAYRTIEDFRGRAVPNVQDWGDLDLNYKIIAEINRGSVHRLPALLRRLRGRRAPVHRALQASRRQKKNVNGMGVHVPRIIEEECVGCNLCALVCPVENCITMKEVGRRPRAHELERPHAPTAAALSRRSPGGDDLPGAA